MSTAEGGPALNDVNTALRDVDTASTDVDTAATASRACSSRATASADASAAVRAAANESAHEGASKRRKKRALEWSEAERKAYWQAKRQQEKKRRKERPPRALTAQETAARQRQALTRARKRRPLDQIEFRGTLVLDCQFDDLMKRKDIVSLSAQLSMAVGFNAGQEQPFDLRLTSIGGKLEAQLELVEFRKWRCRVAPTSQAFVDVFASEPERVVYLCAESDTELTQLDPDNIYVVGALVDHNQHKALCHDFAVKRGLQTARLPLGSVVHVKHRKVLTVNQVVEIMCRVNSGESWTDALLTACPPRRQPTTASDAK